MARTKQSARKSTGGEKFKLHVNLQIPYTSPGKAPRKQIVFEQWGTKTTRSGEKDTRRFAHKIAVRILLLTEPSLGFLDAFRVSHIRGTLVQVVNQALEA